MIFDIQTITDVDIDLPNPQSCRCTEIYTLNLDASYQIYKEIEG
jgi:hypothetical protein